MVGDSSVIGEYSRGARLIVGCCGWPEGKAKYFDKYGVVELQQTFYEPPAVALAQKWRDLAPPSFEFCMKAWQLITHQPTSPTYRRLKSKLSLTETDLLGSFRPTEQVWLAWERTAEVARALRARLILFQCPKSFEPTPLNLRNFCAFFSQIERGEFLLAWEPRGEWSNDLIRELCSEFELLHCVDPFDRSSVYGVPAYWRLHGRGAYSYRYSDEELRQLLAMTHDCPGDVYVLFNNVWMKESAASFQHLSAAAL